MTDRRASTTWTGSLARGRGTVTLASSGAGKFDVSWPSRSEDPNGLTSPEELIARSALVVLQHAALAHDR